MDINKKRLIVICIIIAAALILGVVVDMLWSAIERAAHPDKYKEIITEYSERYAVPESVIYAVIKVESNFKASAVSRAGAMGLMQMMPNTFLWLTGEEHLGEGLSYLSLFDPDVSIRYGTYYLKYLYDKFDGNWETVYAAYNGGEGNVAKWLADPEFSDEDGNLLDIPFAETKNYVQKVKKERNTYQKLYYENEVKENEQH